ncbi:hypothetical protein DL770_010634 [Monosporascus sp. CRB-9-2]|nr:hypothetical protein DL770_010634 [Monosporascus sp. CRB-9-2]
MSTSRSSGHGPYNQSSRRESRRESRSSGGDDRASRDDRSYHVITSDPHVREAFYQAATSRGRRWDITINTLDNNDDEYSPTGRGNSGAGSSRYGRSRSPQGRRSRSPRERRSRTPRSRRPRSPRRWPRRGGRDGRREIRRCAHCQRSGHYSRECVGPVVPMGYLSGTCVECEETGHVYGPRCPKWEETKDTAAMKLIWFRQNKPEAQSDTNLADLLEERLDARDKHWLGARNFYLPWTGLYAWNYQREQEETQGPGLWREYKYSFVGRPDLEAPRRPSDPKRGLCADAREAIQKLRNTGYPTDSARPSVGVPRTSWRRPASSVNGSHLRSRSAMSRHHAEPEGCTNCDQPGHSSSLCPEACRACGSSEHKYRFCQYMFDACICRAYPRHLLKDCQVACELCGDKVPPHRAVECAVRCQYCGKKGHSVLAQCQTTVRLYNGVCRVCKEDRHLVQHCNNAWCPDAECSQRVCCEEHCVNCGYPEELDLQRDEQEGLPHACQWSKGTDPMRPGSGAHIRCPRCGHRVASSGELADVRLSAVARNTSRARDWEAAKAQGQDVGVNPWFDELPECPVCFMAKYPEGDYKIQTKDLNEMPIDND